MREDFESPQDVDGQMAAELYAPLFWRLPVEAAIQSMRPGGPFETPPLGGFALLAQRLMGLLYDPFQNSIDETRALAAHLGRSEPLSSHDDEDDFADHLLHRRRRDWSRSIGLSESAPPTLVWEEVLRDDPFFRGTWIEAHEKFASKANESLVEGRQLRGLLRAKKEQSDLGTHGLLGSYDSSGRVDLYVPVIDSAAEVLGLSPRHLKSVVFIQLLAWAIAHQARDLDAQPGYGFAPSPWVPFNRESPTHVTLIQAFTDRLIRRLQDPSLLAAFEKLSEHQPKAYRRWSAMRTLPLEELRVLLLRARASATALGLPDVIDVE